MTSDHSSNPAEGAKTCHEPVQPVSRRGFLSGLGGLAGSATAAGSIGVGAVTLSSLASADYVDPQAPRDRREAARLIRQQAAQAQFDLPYPDHVCSGDEVAFADRRAQYSKGLPHDALGEVEPMAYTALLTALGSASFADFEAIPLAGARKLACPLGSVTYDMVGPDSHHVTIPAAPPFQSAWQAGEMVEVYWKSLLRDVPFADYRISPMVEAAATDLSQMSDFRGPKKGGEVTAGTLFRGFTRGDLVGPYVSQFLWHDVPYGPTAVSQAYDSIVDGDDRVTTYADWLAVQNGNVPGSPNNVLGAKRYIITGRDLAQYVHFDFSFQAYLNAALILLSYGGGALAENNPYLGSNTMGAFLNYGGPDVLDLVTKAGNAGLKAAWFQKWGVHRRLRPEAYGGRMENQISGAKDYGIHGDVLNSAAASANFSAFGNYLNAQAYAEGSPTHCSYPAGHAVIAGACVTILKAFFRSDFEIPAPVIPETDGSGLKAYVGPTLTIGSELDKLASNISIGRNIAGVHWRTDGDEGMRLGEQVALGILRDYRNVRPEPFDGFEFRSFDGDSLTV